MSVPVAESRWRYPFHQLREEMINGKVPSPTKATIELTMRCNLKCRMCFREQGSEELSEEEVRLVLQKLPATVREIRLIGGEIFLREDIYSILEHISERGLKVRLTTNGTLLDKKGVDRLASYGNILSIGFSLDGPRRLHDRIRGVEGAYESTIRALTMAGARGLPASVNTVLMEENIEHIQELFNEIKDLGIREYRIEPEMYVTEEEAESTGIREITGRRRRGGYPYSYTRLMELKKSLVKAGSKAGVKVTLVPPAAEIEGEAFLRGRLRERKTLFCKHLLIPRVDTKGCLVFCHLIRRRFGSLLENGFDELWNSSEMAELRRDLLESNLYPLCQRCCRLRSI